MDAVTEDSNGRNGSDAKSSAKGTTATSTDNHNISDGDTGSISPGRIDDLDVDNAVFRANGHKPEMNRQFNWISALGLGFSITNSWIGYLSCFGQSFVYGGPKLCILGLVVAFVVQFIITLGLSEIASAFPSSGGQYHFCYILCPDSSKRFTAYLVGWMSVIAWWIVTCSGLSLAAVALSGMVGFFDSSSYSGTGWQIYLIYVGVACSLWFSVVGMFVHLFVTTGMHKHTNPAHYLVQSSLGTSGWNAGTAWILGIFNSMYAFGATDGALHISDEISQPGRRIPQVMMMTMFIGLLTSLPLFIALIVFMTDLDAVVNSALPSMELIYQATGSRNVTLFLESWLLIVYASALPSLWITCGRMAWAFARDNGMPFSRYFVHINHRLSLPVRTTVVAFVFTLLYGLLYLASTTAFNSIVTSAILFLNITYAVPQGILLFYRRWWCREGLPPRYLDLGLFGWFCNLFSVLWIVVLVVVVCMPPALPVATSSMNYTSVIVVGLLGLTVGLWFVSGRKHFRGPQIDLDLLREANVQALATEGVVVTTGVAPSKV